MADRDHRLEAVYDALTGEGDGERLCAAIPDDACSAVPRNYLLKLLNGSCTKLAEQLASPGLVLPWLLGAIGAPAVLVGFLVPVKQAGSLLPQMLVAGRIRGLARRKWAWTGAGLVQSICLVAMVPATLGLPPAAAGASVVALLAIFSLASGVGSVAFQDVMGKTIPRGRRGRLLSQRAAVGGVLTVAAALWIRSGLQGEGDAGAFVPLLLVAAALWAAAALLFGVISEAPGATGGGRNFAGELGAATRLLREQPAYRHFLGLRGLLLSVELATPWYALQAREYSGGDLGGLAWGVLAVGGAKALSSPLWGPFADRSSRAVMVVAALVAALSAAWALYLAGGGLQHPAWYALALALLGVAQGGVRLGRKTWLIDAAPDDERPTWVAVANSSTGLLALGSGALGLLVAAIGLPGLIAVLLGLALLGALAAWRLPAASRAAG